MRSVAVGLISMSRDQHGWVYHHPLSLSLSFHLQAGTRSSLPVHLFDPTIDDKKLKAELEDRRHRPICLNLRPPPRQVLPAPRGKEAKANRQLPTQPPPTSHPTMPTSSANLSCHISSSTGLIALSILSKPSKERSTTLKGRMSPCLQRG